MIGPPTLATSERALKRNKTTTLKVDEKIEQKPNEHIVDHPAPFCTLYSKSRSVLGMYTPSITTNFTSVEPTFNKKNLKNVKLLSDLNFTKKTKNLKFKSLKQVQASAEQLNSPRDYSCGTSRVCSCHKGIKKHTKWNQ